MTADILSWLAEEAGLPMLEELEGSVQANAHASEHAGTDLHHAVAGLTGLSAQDPTLAELVRRARASLRTSMVLGARRVVSVPAGPSSTRLLFLPVAAHAGEDADAAAGVAHELSNALGAISGWAALARRPGAPPETVTQALDRIDRSSRTARQTARHLLGEARGEVLCRDRVDVGLVVREAVELLRPVAEAAEVTVESGTAPDLFVASPQAPLYSIVSNLVQNAIEASPPGGVVAIEARRHRGRIRVEVADQGEGISPTDRARIFDPYFTTKPEGTGLGLALVRKAVEAAGGKLAVRSRPGNGARFAVELPGAAADRHGPKAASTSSKQSGVRARATGLDLRVLVVENDQAMRELVQTTLELHGATVVAVPGSAGAYAAEGPFDVALLDFGLDVRGDTLLAELRRRGSVAAAALVSGSAPPPDLDPTGRPDAWIRKPFDLEDLVETVVRIRSQGRWAAGGRRR